MTRHTFYTILLVATILLGQSGCSINTLSTFSNNNFSVDSEELADVAVELSEELLRQGIDTVAVVDFTGPLGLSSEFEREITEQIFLSMAGFSGKLWVVGGEYLDSALDSGKATDEVWPVMGVKAIVSGTITAGSEKITLRIKVTEARNAHAIHSIQRECRMLDTRDEPAYFAQPEDSRPRNTQQPPYDIPAFPWPPPHASASLKIPATFLHDVGAPATLAQVAQRLESAFAHSGYAERSYYSVPGGFALVSRMEQFNTDGSSKKLPERWAVEVAPPKVFSLSSYVKALFRAQEGHFRIISFLVTSAPFARQSEDSVSQEEALEWLGGGTQRLPAILGSQPYTEGHYCVAMVYEFEQISRNHNAEFQPLSRLPGFAHLKQARLWGELEK